VLDDYNEPLPGQYRLSTEEYEAIETARAFRSPLLLAQKFDKNYQAAKHLNVIDWEFRNLLVDESIDILILSAPVRHGKSLYLSKWAPAWYHLRHPYKNTITTSHTASMALSNSAWVRDKVHELSPLVSLKGVDPGKSAKSYWGLDMPGGGECRAAGVGGAITGFSAHLLLIDDFLKDARAAYSKGERDKQWDWFLAAASTRLEPGGKCVLLCTRWHEDDLIGRILKNRDKYGLRVRSVTLPAMKEDDGKPDPCGRKPGEALWPERWPTQVLERRKKVSSIWWSALYQGRPAAEGTNEFPEEYFKNIWLNEDEWPERYPLLSASYLDPSKAKNDKRDDYQALVYVGYHNGHIIVDSDIDRIPVTKLLRKWVAWDRERRPKISGCEGNAFQELLIGEYSDVCREEGYNHDVPECVINSISKLVRIRRVGPWLSRGLLKFRKSVSNELLIQQLKEFPNGGKDDGPDALDGALRLLVKLLGKEFEESVTETPA
jgi:predicted phage terminase large subunit-like protein